MERKKFPTGAEHYTLFEEIGNGVSASVHRALCVLLNEIVAIKILDFERENCDLNNVFREAQTMVLVDHPNVLKSHCSFVSGHDLWVVMPFMGGGSCLHILKASHPNGLPEAIIATILREILKGLVYLHNHGHIHRDVKSGNILLDSRGGVKLGDFGVSACLFESGDRQRVRNTFVGTPCWMAPEVMEQINGYDFKADMWSFGITALEAHGHAPFSRFPPMKVLLMTLQSSPPGLEDRKNDYFTTSFKHMVGTCLLKDPSKRPSAKKLLKHSFFNQARSSDYISRTLLDGLPALGDRIKDLKMKDEAMAAQQLLPNEEVEEMSQSEYKRGISGWYFDNELLQANLNQDVEEEPRSDHSQPESTDSPPAIDANETPTRSQDASEAPDMGSSRQNPNQSMFLPVIEAASNYENERSQGDNEEVAKEPVVQQRGRFIVTSESVDVEKVVPTTPTLERSQSMKVNSAFPQDPQSSAVTSSPASPSNVASTSANGVGCDLISLLNAVLETNLAQRDLILNIMKVVSASESSAGDGASSSTSHMNLLEEVNERENELLQRMTNLKLRFPTIPEGSETGQTDTEKEDP